MHHIGLESRFGFRRCDWNPSEPWFVYCKEMWNSENITHTIHGTGIFTYLWLIFMVNIGKYTIHGSYGSLKRIDLYTITSSKLCCYNQSTPSLWRYQQWVLEEGKHPATARKQCFRSLKAYALGGSGLASALPMVQQGLCRWKKWGFWSLTFFREGQQYWPNSEGQPWSLHFWGWEFFF